MEIILIHSFIIIQNVALYYFSRCKNNKSQKLMKLNHKKKLAMKISIKIDKDFLHNCYHTSIWLDIVRTSQLNTNCHTSVV